jgi:peptide-methionine (S)-S-oxide reductase
MRFSAIFFSILLILSPHSSRAEMKTVILAGGCFWCLQHDMEGLKGVTKTEAGYAGGDRENPTYQNYHTLNEQYTVPHIEVVNVTYDSDVVALNTVFSFFLRKIDPTDNGGQFCDRGPAYRPAIFFSSPEEKAKALEQIHLGEKETGQAFSLELLPAATFWPAEEYHQHYATKNTVRYKFYRYKCGRDARVKKLWTSP